MRRDDWETAWAVLDRMAEELMRTPGDEHGRQAVREALAVLRKFLIRRRPAEREAA